MAEEMQDQIITFDEKEYKYSELSDRGKVVVNQLNIVESDILQTKMLLDRHEAAKQTFVATFKEIVTEVEVKE
jgi:hypothetical protein